MLDNLAIDGYREYVSGVGSADYQSMRWLDGAHNQSYNCHYAFVDTNGDLHRFAYHTCFGRLNQIYYWFPNYTPHTILIQVNTEFFSHLNVSDEMFTTYFKWLYEVSPFKSVFSNTYEEAINDGVVAIDANAESGLIGNACSAVRLIWEHWYIEYNLPSIVNLWYAVVNQHDVDPTVAFAFCNSVIESGGMYNIRGSTAGHQFLPSVDSHALTNFIDGKIEKTKKFSQTKAIEGINSVWYEDNHQRIKGGLNAWMKLRFLGQAKKVNIFQPDSHSIHFTKEQAIAGIVRCVNDYQQERDV